MTEQSELETAYSKIRQVYSLTPTDTDMESLKKLLAASNIEHFTKDKYIEGLKQLVTDLKKEVARLESVLAAVKK